MPRHIRGKVTTLLTPAKSQLNATLPVVVVGRVPPPKQSAPCPQVLDPVAPPPLDPNVQPPLALRQVQIAVPGQEVSVVEPLGLSLDSSINHEKRGVQPGNPVGVAVQHPPAIRRESAVVRRASAARAERVARARVGG